MEPAGSPQPQPIAPLVQRPPTPSEQGRIVPLNKNKTIVWSVILVIELLAILGLILFIWIYINPRVGNQIVVGNQSVTSSIHVDRISIKTKAFLVFQSLNDFTYEMNLGSHLANTILLIPGTYENFNLDLVEAAELSSTPGAIIVATLYHDSNKNGIYDTEKDTQPLTDILGNNIRVEFQLD